MQNYIQPGCTLTLTAPYNRDSGEGAKIGAFFGVACSDVDSGDDGEFQLEGVFTLAKTTSQTWTAGDRLYWDDSGKKLSTVATVGMFVGIAAADAGSSDATGDVKLCPSAELYEGAQAAVADVATADADGTYGSPEATLINELKTQLNALLAKLRIAGIIAP